MYGLLFFVVAVVLIAIVSCISAKKIGKRCNVDPKEQIWIVLAITGVAILVYEWFDHHREPLKRTLTTLFGRRGNSQPEKHGK